MAESKRTLTSKTYKSEKCNDVSVPLWNLQWAGQLQPYYYALIEKNSMKRANSMSRFGIAFSEAAVRDGMSVGAIAKAPNAEVFGCFGLLPIHLWWRFIVDCFNPDNDISGIVAVDSKAKAKKPKIKETQMNINDDKMDDEMADNSLRPFICGFDDVADDDTAVIGDDEYEYQFLEDTTKSLVFAPDKYCVFAQEFVARYKKCPYYFQSDSNEVM